MHFRNALANHFCWKFINPKNVCQIWVDKVSCMKFPSPIYYSIYSWYAIIWIYSNHYKWNIGEARYPPGDRPIELGLFCKGCHLGLASSFGNWFLIADWNLTMFSEIFGLVSLRHPWSNPEIPWSNDQCQHMVWSFCNMGGYSIR